MQRLLFSKILAEIRKSKLDYEINDGKSFGIDFLERLNGAVNSIFSLGYENVIVLGDDTPKLSHQTILQAAKNLAEKKISIGPTKDGGTYLIAFNKKQYAKEILEKLTWHSSEFKNELIGNIRTAGLNYEKLIELEDIDSKTDLAVFLSKNINWVFTIILKNLLFYIHKIQQKLFAYSLKFVEYSSDRAPPVTL